MEGILADALDEPRQSAGAGDAPLLTRVHGRALWAEVQQAEADRPEGTVSIGTLEKANAANYIESVAYVSSGELARIIDAHTAGKASSAECRIFQIVRFDALAAYEQADPRRHRMRRSTLEEFLASGNAKRAGIRTDVEPRTAQKWAVSFLAFASGFVLLTDEDTAARRDRQRELDRLFCDESHGRSDHSAVPVLGQSVRSQFCGACQAREIRRVG